MFKKHVVINNDGTVEEKTGLGNKIKDFCVEHEDGILAIASGLAVMSYGLLMVRLGYNIGLKAGTDTGYVQRGLEEISNMKGMPLYSYQDENLKLTDEVFGKVMDEAKEGNFGRLDINAIKPENLKVVPTVVMNTDAIGIKLENF